MLYSLCVLLVAVFFFVLFFFFFSSRRRHTRCLSDWSSDVCSSDLPSAGSSLRHCRLLLPGDLLDLRTFGSRCCLIGNRGRGGRAACARLRTRPEIGRASCRERVEITVVAVSLKKKKRGRV